LTVKPAASRVVIDTNVWISGALSRQGAPAQVVRRVLAHGVPVLTPETYAELESRFWKPKFDPYLSVELRRRILLDLQAVAHWAGVTQELAVRTWCRDSDDDKFVRAALASGAAWLVTGDRDLLDVGDLPGLRILSSVAALGEPEFCRETI
jgi:putative PIN family toxin of toxin-antitoxin system